MNGVEPAMSAPVRPAAAVIGSGAWGTTFAGLLAQAGTPTTIWARRREVAEEINAGTNERYVPGHRLPQGLKATTDLAQAVTGASVVVVAADDEQVAARIASLCATGTFRPYTNTDVLGVELCGAVKNVIALAVGAAAGRGLGDNSKATIITRGLVEITRLGLKLGARPETFSGLAGMGDLVATCSSPLSRNQTFGRHLGEGMSVAEAAAASRGVAEGAKSARAVLDLARAHGVDMPITAGVVTVVEGAASVAQVTDALLARPRKSEGVHAAPSQA